MPCARSLARRIVLEWGRCDLVDTAELLVSELVTNAIQASAGLRRPVVRLWLVAERDNIVIRVWDGSADMPTRQDAGPESEHGRGLMLVGSLSKQWGACVKPAGKVVWVQTALTARIAARWTAEGRSAAQRAINGSTASFIRQMSSALNG